jgi:hypothetical protein
MNAMNAPDLDTAYTALANASHAVGRERESLFLATLALSLIAQQSDITKVLEHIAQAQRLAGS